MELGLGQNYLMVMTSSLSQTSLDFLPFDPAKTTGTCLLLYGSSQMNALNDAFV
jgi:hypothetical protein